MLDITPDLITNFNHRQIPWGTPRFVLAVELGRPIGQCFVSVGEAEWCLLVGADSTRCTGSRSREHVCLGPIVPISRPLACSDLMWLSKQTTSCMFSSCEVEPSKCLGGRTMIGDGTRREKTNWRRRSRLPWECYARLSNCGSEHS